MSNPTTLGGLLNDGWIEGGRGGTILVKLFKRARYIMCYVFMCKAWWLGRCVEENIATEDIAAFI